MRGAPGLIVLGFGGALPGNFRPITRQTGAADREGAYPADARGPAAAAPSGLSGQALREALVDDAAGAPLQAVLVDVLAAGGDTPLQRTASDVRGRFGFAPLQAGGYRLRVNRIGFRPWVSPEFSLSVGQVLDSTWRVASEPIVLTEIVVEAESSCRASPQDDRAMALVWDEVRKTLRLMQHHDESNQLEFVFSRVRTRIDSAGIARVLGRFPGGGRGAWPITSQAPESLATLGYVQPRDTLFGPIYYGPDPDVFFSDPFLRTHCFHMVQPPADRPGWIGLGFRPIPDRQIPDIEGVLWLTRQDATLRRLEYRYTRLWSWVPPGRAGGSLEFERLPGGQPVVTGWTIRAPIASRVPATAGGRRGDPETVPFFGRGRITLQGFLVEEAEVERILGPTGAVIWPAPPPPEARRQPQGS